jgi:hypothetical protein
MNRLSAMAIAACITGWGVLAASVEPAWPSSKDQSRIVTGDYGSTPDPGPRGEKSDLGVAVPERADSYDKQDYTMPSEALGIEDISDVDTVELTVDSAKRALDAFAEVRDKYTGEGLENYNSLEQFVQATEAGKRLEADVMAHGFSDITEWNVAIMAVGFAYSAIIYDYEADLHQQIEDVRNDPEIDEELRARLIAGLTALMPSHNNRVVLLALFDDPIYRDKLKLLQEEE